MSCTGRRSPFPLSGLPLRENALRRLSIAGLGIHAKYLV
jgi:hypothetical protein